MSFRLVGANGVPGDLAAERVQFAKALFDVLVLATWRSIFSAAVAAAGTAGIGARSTKAVPLHIAAERVVGAYAILNFGVVATGGAVGNAAGAFTRASAAVHFASFTVFAECTFALAVTATLAAVHGAVFTILGAGAGVIPALLTTAGSAAQALDFVHAEAVPVHVTTERIVRAHASLDGSVVATRRSVGLAAVAVAGAAFVGFLSTKTIPLYVTAERVHFAHAGLHVRVVTTGSAVGHAARTFARAAILGAGDAVLVVTAVAVAASRLDALALDGQGVVTRRAAVAVDYDEVLLALFNGQGQEGLVAGHPVVVNARFAVAADGRVQGNNVQEPFHVRPLRQGEQRGRGAGSDKLVHILLGSIVAAYAVVRVYHSFAQLGGPLIGLTAVDAPHRFALIHALTAVFHAGVAVFVIFRFTHTVAAAVAAVIGADVAILGTGAIAVAALFAAAATATEIFNFRGANAVPRHVAAERVDVAHAGLNAFVIAPGGVARLAAVAGARAALIGLGGADAVPGHIAAERVHGANTSFHGGVGAAGAAVGDAARTFAGASTAVRFAGNTVLAEFGFAHAVAAAVAAVFRAPGAIFVAVTLAIAALDAAAVTATKVFHFSGAQVVPRNVTAVGILFAHARFNKFIVAAGSIAGLTAVAGAGAAFVGFGSADAVPFRFAAVRVHGADAILYFRIVAADGAVGHATGALAGASAAVLGTPVAVFTQLRLAQAVAAAVAAVFRTGEAVFITGAEAVAALLDAATVQPAFGDSFVHADGVPGHVAAEGIEFTYAPFDTGLLASRLALGQAAVADTAGALDLEVEVAFPAGRAVNHEVVQLAGHGVQRYGGYAHVHAGPRGALFVFTTQHQQVGGSRLVEQVYRHRTVARSDEYVGVFAGIVDFAAAGIVFNIIIHARVGGGGNHAALNGFVDVAHIQGALAAILGTGEAVLTTRALADAVATLGLANKSALFLCLGHAQHVPEHFAAEVIKVAHARFHVCVVATSGVVGGAAIAGALTAIFRAHHAVLALFAHVVAALGAALTVEVDAVVAISALVAVNHDEVVAAGNHVENGGGEAVGDALGRVAIRPAFQHHHVGSGSFVAQGHRGQAVAGGLELVGILRTVVVELVAGV